MFAHVVITRAPFTRDAILPFATCDYARLPPLFQVMGRCGTSDLRWGLKRTGLRLPPPPWP
jgi:hypothetical protein